MRRVHPFRQRTPDEEQVLARTAHASSEPVAVVTRARALPAVVHAGSASPPAAREASARRAKRVGIASASGWSASMSSMSRGGRHSTGGRGRQARDTPAQCARLRAAQSRVPDRTADAPATCSLKTLQGTLRPPPRRRAPDHAPLRPRPRPEEAAQELAARVAWRRPVVARRTAEAHRRAAPRVATVRARIPALHSSPSCLAGNGPSRGR
jgi:hypothetical protein